MPWSTRSAIGDFIDYLKPSNWIVIGPLPPGNNTFPWSKACSNIEINIKGTTKHMFIKQADVVDVLNKNTVHAGETLDEINLRKTEEQLKSNPWIKDAELFFDNHQILHVKISEREPVARVFTKTSNRRI